MKTLITFFALFFLFSCSQPEPLYKRQLYTFGTLVELTVYGGERQLAEQAFDKVALQLEEMHEQWHPWQSGELAQLNRGIKDGGVEVSASLLAMLKQAGELSASSGGLFNPAIGQLVRLWGFDKEVASEVPPPEAWINTYIENNPRMVDLKYDGNKVSTESRTVAIDLGAFAKGYAVDRVVEELQGMGITNAIVNAGGDLRAFGKHGERPWRVGVRNPRAKGVLASIEINGNESVFTSGDYERFFLYKRKRYHHILDPRTGYPATGVSSVTVIHDNAATADAAATALFVAGPKQWPAVARSMGVSEVMMVDDKGEVYMSPTMEARVKFEGEPPKAIWISPAL